MEGWYEGNLLIEGAAVSLKAKDARSMFGGCHRTSSNLAATSSTATLFLKSVLETEPITHLNHLNHLNQFDSSNVAQQAAWHDYW